MANVTDEASEIAQSKLDAMKALSWEELDAYGVRVEEVSSRGGRRFRVKSSAAWDVGEWESEVGITVKVYAPSGLRRFWPVTAHGGRGGPDDLIPPILIGLAEQIG